MRSTLTYLLLFISLSTLLLTSNNVDSGLSYDVNVVIIADGQYNSIEASHCESDDVELTAFTPFLNSFLPSYLSEQLLPINIIEHSGLFSFIRAPPLSITLPFNYSGSFNHAVNA